MSLAEQLEARGTRMVTTPAVLLEIGNALEKLHHRRAAARLLASIRSDPDIEVVPLSDELFAQGLKLYSERPDQEWSLTDCVSFVIMRTRGIADALTTDEHFQQAGFRILLHQ